MQTIAAIALACALFAWGARLVFREHETWARHDHEPMPCPVRYTAATIVACALIALILSALMGWQ